MSETEIIETDTQGLRSKLLPVDYHRDHLAEILERRLGPQYATLLARRTGLPQGRIVWSIAGVEKPVPFAALTGAEQERLKLRLSEMGYVMNHDSAEAKAREVRRIVMRKLLEV